ncbi:MAG: sporulation peptidase YabG [Ignavibacteriales bacterium]
MPEIKVGNIVARKSYGFDTIFKVENIKEGQKGERIITLKGVDFRIEADSLESDLKIMTDQELEKTELKGKNRNKNFTRNVSKKDSAFFLKGKQRGVDPFTMTGKILHIDGAKDYLDKCKKYYAEIGAEVVVIDVPEKDQPLKVQTLLQQYKPDILVLTGHDGMTKENAELNNIQNYRNSLYFVNAVKEARKYNNSLDDLVIFAGACQSNYEAILEAGANYASSPKRVFIHMFDPAAVACKISLTGISRVLPVSEVIADTNSGLEGVGGVETWGKARTGAPKGSY